MGDWQHPIPEQEPLLKSQGVKQMAMQENMKSYVPDAPFDIEKRSSHPTTMSLFSLEKAKGVVNRFMDNATLV